MRPQLCCSSLIVHVVRWTDQHINLAESGFQILPVDGFEYRRAKLCIGDGGIENETAGLPQLTSGNVQILNGAKPSFLAGLRGVGEYLGDQNVEQVERIIRCRRFQRHSERHESRETALIR